MNAGLAYLCLVFVMSIVTFIIYGFDKHRAGNGDRRVPERMLHLLASWAVGPVPCLLNDNSGTRLRRCRS